MYLNKNVQKKVYSNQEKFEKIQISLEVYHALTAKQKNIATALFDVSQASYFNNNNLHINPSSKYLAKKANCSVRTVENFNKKFRIYFKNLINIQRTFKKRREYLNQFTFDKSFFQAMFLLKLSGNLYNKSYQRLFITEFSENQEITVRNLTVDNQKLRGTNPQKCGAIITLFNNTLDDYKVPIQKVLDTKEIKEKAKENLEIIEFNMNGIKINTQQRKYFLNNYTLGILQKSIDDLRFYKHKGNVPDNEFGVLYRRAQYYNLDRKNRFFKETI